MEGTEQDDDNLETQSKGGSGHYSLLDPNVIGLDGIEQAAIILMSLKPESMSQVLGLMSQYEIRLLSKALAIVETVRLDKVEKVLVEALTFFQKANLLSISIDETKKILASSLGLESMPEETDDFFEGETWKKLSKVDGDILASYFANEHPQTIALVVSRLNVTTSSKLLSSLPKEVVPDILLRVAKMDNVRGDLLSSIGESLKTEFVINYSSNKIDFKKQVADIINSCERSVGESFVASLKRIDSEVGAYVEDNIFTIERLLSIDDAGIQRILRDIDKSQLALALKGTDKEIKELFFKNMSERAGKIIKDDMSFLGPVKVSEVEGAQSYVIGVVKDLIDKEEVSISDEKGGGLIE